MANTLLGGGSLRTSAVRAMQRVLTMRLDLTRCGGVLADSRGRAVLPQGLCPLVILLGALDFMCDKLRNHSTVDCVGILPVKARLCSRFLADGKAYGTIKLEHMREVLRREQPRHGPHRGDVNSDNEEGAGEEAEADDDTDGASTGGDTLAWVLYAADAEMRRVQADNYLARFLPLLPDAWVSLTPTVADLTDFSQGKRSFVVLPRSRAVLLLSGCAQTTTFSITVGTRRLSRASSSATASW